MAVGSTDDIDALADGRRRAPPLQVVEFTGSIRRGFYFNDARWLLIAQLYTAFGHVLYQRAVNIGPVGAEADGSASGVIQASVLQHQEVVALRDGDVCKGAHQSVGGSRCRCIVLAEVGTEEVDVSHLAGVVATVSVSHYIYIRCTGL